jgi:hypothetical protein
VKNFQSSDVEHTIARRCGNARLDPAARLVLDARPKIAYMAVQEADDAGLTDAHPAPERHPDSDLFAGVHQGSGGVHRHGLPAASEFNRASTPT